MVWLGMNMTSTTSASIITTPASSKSEMTMITVSPTATGLVEIPITPILKKVSSPTLVVIF